MGSCKSLIEHLTAECVHCYYCGNYLASRHEHDHFPIPKIAGGTKMVPTCINCHDLKDRQHDGANPDFMGRGIIDLIGDRAEDLAKKHDGLSRSTVTIDDIVAILGNAEDRWTDLSVEARIVYASVVALQAHMRIRAVTE